MELEHHGSNTPCIYCPANSTTMPWRDFRAPRALWMSQIWTHTAWSAAHAHRNALLKLEFVTVHCLYVDLMHAKYLGTDMYFLGSVLWLLCYDILPGISTTNTLRIAVFSHAYCRVSHTTQYTILHLQMLTL